MPPFAEWFRACHGYEPYPWQGRLAAHVVEYGKWPDTIGVPTGAGKTATLDIALHALAAEADLPPPRRKAPRRVVMVVDRRTVVDQSFERASLIRQRLVEAEDGPLAVVRERLRALMGIDAELEAPLQLALLRGGVPRDDGWARRPDQALIALSTVDQVGSRLLFRGYGVSPTMRSLHAGLLGQDTLFLLDEVHLARAFEETLTSLRERWRSWAEVSLPSRWQVSTLSATSGDAAAFALSDDDRRLPSLARRLGARKPLRLVELATATHDRQRRLSKPWVAGLAKEARSLIDAGCSCVGVVVNRVDTAAAVAAELERVGTADVLLVTGRMRGPDRAEVAQQLADRAGPSWVATDAGRPFVCVATQAIEAGADLDFDGMVTELASLDSLIQRFGRANRTGRHESAPVVVVAPKKPESIDDPVYGAALGPTWAFLLGLGEGADVGPDSIDGVLDGADESVRAPSPRAAVLLPAHPDLLSQTSHAVHPDPDPGLYLRGLDPPRAEISIVWRADVDIEDPDRSARRLAAVPPTAWEALQLPFGAALGWLANSEAPSVADVEGDAARDRVPARSRVGLRWTGGNVEVVGARDIRPGDTIVLPSERGGLASGNFAPRAREPVLDAGDLARTVRDGRPLLRLDPAVHPGLEALAGVPSGPDGHAVSAADAARAVRKWLPMAAAAADSSTHLGKLLGLLVSTGVGPEWLGGAWLLRGTTRLPASAVLLLARGRSVAPPDQGITADDRSWLSSTPVALQTHLAGVERFARSFAVATGLPPTLVDDLASAGRWHDLGKAHPQFQVLLHGGDEIRAAGGPLLAKSGPRLADRDGRRRAYARSGLRRGFRHEMASVSLLQGDAGQQLLDACHDPDLVLHLVASHHGHARPFAPLEGEGAPPVRPTFNVDSDGVELAAPADHGLDRLDSGVADRFWRLQRRYGWWGLAWLEALLRLADHRRSEAEERDEESRR